MKVTIDRINRGEKETRFGLKRSVGLTIRESSISDINGATIEVGGRWLNCLYDVDKTNGSEDWQSGDVVDIEVKVNGEYLNFRPSKATDVKMATLEQKVETMWKHLGLDKEPVVEPETIAEDPNDNF